MTPPGCPRRSRAPAWPRDGAPTGVGAAGVAAGARRTGRRRGAHRSTRSCSAAPAPGGSCTCVAVDEEDATSCCTSPGRSMVATAPPSPGRVRGGRPRGRLSRTVHRPSRRARRPVLAPAFIRPLDGSLAAWGADSWARMNAGARTGRRARRSAAGLAAAPTGRSPHLSLARRAGGPQRCEP